ncbi:MAG: biopolymer transporter ExbD [Lentisphaeria bacterium]|jgi:biopolymer transport protein ExbD
MAKRSAQEPLNVPMAPMIDVVFQLLIYFVLTFKQEIPEAHLAVNLPSRPKSPPPGTPPPVLNLTVQPRAYLLGGAPIALDRLRTELKELGALNPDVTIVIQVSQSAKADQVVKVLDACKGGNLSQLNLMTLK